MVEDRLKIWEGLFQRALELIDSAQEAGAIVNWSFGGGTALMLRHRHRLSKDIDIFVSDPQVLAYVTPRLSDKAESITANYVEQAGFVKLILGKGEIDFVVAGPLTNNPTVTETLFDRKVQVETSTEIVGKKVWYRGAQFTGRDILDLAMVSEKEPEALIEIKPILRGRRDSILKRIATQAPALKENFSELEVLNYKRSFEECVDIVKQALS